jgi:hypothetical protein
MWIATHAGAGRRLSKNEDQTSDASLTHLNPFHAPRAAASYEYMLNDEFKDKRAFGANARTRWPR